MTPTKRRRRFNTQTLAIWAVTALMALTLLAGLIRPILRLSPARASVPASSVSTPLTTAQTSPESTWHTARGQTFRIQYPSDRYSARVDDAIRGIDLTPRADTAATYTIRIGSMPNTAGLPADTAGTLLGQGPVIQYTADMLAGHPLYDTTLGSLNAVTVDDLQVGVAGITMDSLAVTTDEIYEVVVEPAQVSGDPAANLPLVIDILKTFDAVR